MNFLTDEKQKIIDAIEYSPHMYTPIEGVFEKIPIENLSGFRCPSVDFEEFNAVGMSRIEEDQLEDTIKQVVDFYTSAGLTKIAWIVSPQSKPDTLVEKLESAGFKKEIPVLGMYRSIGEELNISITEEFEFKAKTLDEFAASFNDPEFCRMVERAYGMPEGAAGIYKMMGLIAQGMEVTFYVAYEKKENKPVGIGGLLYVPGTKIGLLGGAATLPEYRGKGIYSAMLKLRNEKAKKDGKENLIIQAKEATSAPIAEKNGFEKVCELPFYVWRKTD